jgi:UDPglucose 6-dehydrogenase
MKLPILFTDRRSAEMIKYASNDYLALKLSYINEIANLCEILGADVSDVAKGMGMDPGLGTGSCKPASGMEVLAFPRIRKPSIGCPTITTTNSKR